MFVSRFYKSTNILRSGQSRPAQDAITVYPPIPPQAASHPPPGLGGGAVGCHHHRPQPGVVEGYCRRWRAVQHVQRHPVAPDRSAALHDHERAAGDGGQWWQRLGGGDGRGDGDGVDDGSGHVFANSILTRLFKGTPIRF